MKIGESMIKGEMWQRQGDLAKSKEKISEKPNDHQWNFQNKMIQWVGIPYMSKFIANKHLRIKEESMMKRDGVQGKFLSKLTLCTSPI